MDLKALKKELVEKIGSHNFLDESFLLINKVNYISGIKIFDDYLDGRSLKQISAIVKFEKHPKGFAILIAKNFSTVPYGIKYSDINKIDIEGNNLKIITNENENLFFEIRNEEHYYINNFFQEYLTNIDENLNEGNLKIESESQHEPTHIEIIKENSGSSYIAIVSSILMALGCFLPWLQLGVIFKNKGIDNPPGAIILVLAIICSALGFINLNKKEDKHQAIFIICGIIGALVFYFVFSEASERAQSAANSFNDVKEALGESRNLSNSDFIGSGLYVVLLGSIGLILSGTKILKL